MDNSLTLARHFARLVWLMIHESQAIDGQKVALRAVVFVSKEASVRLGNKEGRLAVNGLVMPQALAGVQELAQRLSSHAIEEIVLDQGAVPAELLGLARLLAIESGTSSDAADFSRRLAELPGKTVRLRFVEAKAEAPARTSGEKTQAETGPVGADQRARFLFTKLSEAATPFAVAGVLDEIAFVAEQATREGRTTDAADIFATLLDREAAVADPEIRRGFAMTARRLTKPTILRAIAYHLTAEPARAAQTERILRRCGQDGVDAVVDLFASAGSGPQRRAYRDVLFQLPAVRQSLVQMLADPRWYVVRQAADLLGELGPQEAERALADLLRHPDERVRRAATRALARTETPFTIDALARALGDDAVPVRLEAIAGLIARKSTRAGSTLAAAVDKETEAEVQFALLAALGRIASPEAVQKLTAAAAATSGVFKARKNSALRVAAVAALGEARTPGALAALQALVNDREKEVRDAAVRTLMSEKGSAA